MLVFVISTLYVVVFDQVKVWFLGLFVVDVFTFTLL
jgi:hypothetical protein